MSEYARFFQILDTLPPNNDYARQRPHVLITKENTKLIKKINMDGVLVLIIILLIPITAFVGFLIYVCVRKDPAHERRMAFEKKKKEQKRIEKEEYPIKVAQLTERLGKCTIDINLGNWDEYKIQKHFFVFEGSQTIIINQREYKFIDILGYSLVDDATSESVMTSTGESKTSTGSMIGRAVVGGVLTGGLGAVAGAATAKRNTSDVGTSTTTTTHKYTVYLNVDSLENPTEKLFVGNNSDKAYKIANILNVIIERNKK